MFLAYSIMTFLENCIMLYTNQPYTYLKEKDIRDTRDIRDIKIIPYKGKCMLKNKNGINCPIKNTYLINSVGKCICEYHLNNNKNRVLNLINFYKMFNKYIKNVYLYKDDRENFIENLKDIILLLIKNEKYKFTLSEYFNFVTSYINNFDIYDDEYNALLDYYRSII